MPLCKLCQEVLTVSKIDAANPGQARPGQIVVTETGRQALSCIQHFQQRHPGETATINATMSTFAHLLILRNFDGDGDLRAGHEAAAVSIKALVESIEKEITARREAEAAELYRKHADLNEPPRPMPGKSRLVVK